MVKKTDNDEAASLNEVRLVGRVSGAPVERSLPSGDVLVSVRLVVPRVQAAVRADGRRGQTVDVFDCVAWTARLRRSVAAWRDGDEVAVEGAVRRRFFRAGGATSTRVEIEIRAARRRRRAA